MAEHTITIEAEDGDPSATALNCHAPADGMCHAVWACDCEAFYDVGIRNGVPAHRPDYDDPDTWHAGTIDPAYCNLRDWFDGQDECLDGSIEVPVKAVWEFDYVTFELLQPGTEPGGSES